eukprot:GEMP01002761.1.p1 GENE.GEMP01002761.1~~GEMP01002761.1.p1  ORF type:complete len:1052 (+),score=214.14 GEMP01002761.1:222-3377(+)
MGIMERMLGIVLGIIAVGGVTTDLIPLNILGIFPTHLGGTTRYNVRESAYSSQGFRISAAETPEAKWIQRFSFFAYSTLQPHTSQYFVHVGSGPERYMVSASQYAPEGWATHSSFFAYPTQNNTLLNQYFCAQDKEPSMDDDEKYVVAVSNVTASTAPWGVRPLQFYAYPPDIVLESIRYMAALINTEKELLPEYKIVVHEEYDSCDLTTGRSLFLKKLADFPAKFYGLFGFRCAATEQMSLLAPILRLPNIGLSSQAQVATYENAWRLHVNEADYTDAMFDIIEDICKWHRVGISISGPRYKPHADQFTEFATNRGIAIGFLFDTMASENVGKSAWESASETNSRIVAVFGPASDIARLLCDQIKEMRSGLVILSTYRPKSDTDLFWRDFGDPKCTNEKMDEAAETMLFFGDPHQRSDNVQLGCINKKSTDYDNEWKAHIANNNIDPNGISSNAADSICVFAKMAQDFKAHLRRFTIHDESRNINSASAMCIERGGFIAIINDEMPSILKSAIEAGSRSSYMINAKRVGNGQWKTLDYEMLDIPMGFWQPYPQNGKATHDYVGLRVLDGELKLEELGDAVGISGDDTVGYICEYQPMSDMASRTSEDSFVSMNERMKLIDFQGLTGRLRFKATTFSHTIRTFVKVWQVKKLNAQYKNAEVGKYDLSDGTWWWSGGSMSAALKWLEDNENACLTGGDGFPVCATGKRQVWYGCSWIPCNETDGMLGTAPACVCTTGWYNKTVGDVAVLSWSCEKCTPDVDSFYCPENRDDEEDTISQTNETDIDPAMIVLITLERRIALTLMVPSNVKSVTLNAAFAEAIELAAGEVYGFDSKIEVNYITTGGWRRRLHGEEDGPNEFESFRLLSEPIVVEMDLSEDATEGAAKARRLQNVLHTTVMFKVSVEKRRKAQVLAREATFSEQMKMKLNQAFETENELAGFSVVQVDIPAPEPKSQMVRTLNCTDVSTDGDGQSAVEILGYLFIGIVGLIAILGCVWFVKHRVNLRKMENYITKMSPVEQDVEDSPEKMIAIADDDPAGFIMADDNANETAQVE